MRAAVCLLFLATALLPGCAAPIDPVESAASSAAKEAPVVPATPTAAPSAQPITDSIRTPSASPSASSVPTGTPTVEPQTAKPAVPAKEQEGPGQAVVVIASGYTARVTFYERNGSAWKKLVETKGCVGRAGITSAKREGDKKTPCGMYALRFAFGMDQPDTKMEFRPITGESYWVDDSQSEYYNTWQEGYKGWRSAEKLSEYPDYYHYAVAIAYNEACEPGRGSAIFLHCKIKASTTGCVAVPRSAMLKILKALDPAKQPVIIIAGSAEEAERYGGLKLPCAAHS